MLSITNRIRRLSAPADRGCYAKDADRDVAILKRAKAEYAKLQQPLLGGCIDLYSCPTYHFRQWAHRPN
jgi:hypothetical protein